MAVPAYNQRKSGKCSQPQGLPLASAAKFHYIQFRFAAVSKGLTIFVLQAFAYAMMSAGSAASGVTNLNRTGIRHTALPNFCKPLHSFCDHVAISIAFTFVSCILLAMSAVQDVMWLSNNWTHFSSFDTRCCFPSFVRYASWEILSESLSLHNDQRFLYFGNYDDSRRHLVLFLKEGNCFSALEWLRINISYCRLFDI